MTTDDTVRDYCVAKALPYAGCSAAPSTELAYGDLIAPIDVEGKSLHAAMEQMWSCGLTLLGLYRKLGLKDDVLWKPYVIGTAISNVVDVWQAHDAVVHGAAGVRKGNGILIDGGYHCIAVVTSDPDADGVFTTIEGGQVDAKGFKAIKALRRKLVGNMLYSVDGTSRHTIFMCGDCAKLGIVVPSSQVVDPSTLLVQPWTLPEPEDETPPDAG